MGADVVIAVDLSSDVLGRRFRAATTAGVPSTGNVQKWLLGLQQHWHAVAADKAAETADPSVLDVLAASLDIVLVRTARSRMAGEPADVVVAPRLAHLRLFDFHRANEAIEEGRRAVERAAQNLALLDGLSP
jgi:NTE family protein